jgi:sigma-E factor negative regulatory protein RseC
MKDHTLCKEGIIRAITDTEFVVETMQSSACSGCRAKTLCSMDRKSELMRIPRCAEDEAFAIEDQVHIKIASSAGAKAVIWGYLFPLLVLVITLFTVYTFTHNDLISVFVALACTAFYYLILNRLNKKIAKKIVFYLTKL